mgnify:CR=1 FL=1
MFDILHILLQSNSERNVAEELEEAISSGKFNPAADVTSPGGSTADSGGPTEQPQVTNYVCNVLTGINFNY